MSGTMIGLSLDCLLFQVPSLGLGLDIGYCTIAYVSWKTLQWIKAKSANITLPSITVLNVILGSKYNYFSIIFSYVTASKEINIKR